MRKEVFSRASARPSGGDSSDQSRSSSRWVHNQVQLKFSTTAVCSPRSATDAQERTHTAKAELHVTLASAPSMPERARDRRRAVLVGGGGPGGAACRVAAADADAVARGAELDLRADRGRRAIRRRAGAAGAGFGRAGAFELAAGRFAAIRVVERGALAVLEAALAVARARARGFA